MLPDVLDQAPCQAVDLPFSQFGFMDAFHVFA